MLMATFENKSTALAMYTPSNDMNGGPWLDGSYAYMVGDCSTNASAGTYDVLPSA